MSPFLIYQYLYWQLLIVYSCCFVFYIRLQWGQSKVDHGLFLGLINLHDFFEIVNINSNSTKCTNSIQYDLNLNIIYFHHKVRFISFNFFLHTLFFNCT